MMPVDERYAVRDKVEITVAVYEGYKQTCCPADVDSTGSPQVVGRATDRVPPDTHPPSPSLYHSTPGSRRGVVYIIVTHRNVDQY
jgi:hypothetical protein